MSSPRNKIPSVDPLYFSGKEGNDSMLSELPSELLQMCLVEYNDWGELAKLATVQSSWKNLLLDAAADNETKWQLAEALLGGTNGLEANPELALRLLHQISGVDQHTMEQVSEPFAPAMKRIAECYFEGSGVEKSGAQGVNWLTAAYKSGQDVDAAHELALVFEYSKHGVEIDVVAAAQWFCKAAEGGHVEAMAEYAMCCELGCGREQCDEEALNWYMKAANAGHVNANFSVGEAFEEARGVPQSDEEACLWYYKAAVEGDEDSKRALRRLHDIARIVVPGVGGLLAV